MSAGIWIGVTTGIIVLVLAFWKPVLAKMGIGYAFERKQQTALIVAGLMIATTVIAAAGITADSSGATFAESITGRIYVTDAVVQSYTAQSHEDMERLATGASFSDDIVATATTYRRDLPFESAITGMGSTHVAHVGVDPTDYAKVARWEALDGTAPTSLAVWARGDVVVNELAAKAYGLAVEDPVNVFLGDEPVLIQNRTVYDGHFVAEAHVDTGVLSGTSVSHPDNVDTFRHPMERLAYEFTSRTAIPYPITILAEGPSDVELQLIVHDPGNQQYESAMTAGRAELVIEEPRNFGKANWTLEVTSSSAQDVTFNVTVIQPLMRVLDAAVYTYTVAAIIESQGSDPAYNDAVVFMHMRELESISGVEDRANFLFIDMADSADLRDVRTELEARLEQGSIGGWAEAPRLELEEFRRGIELATQAVFLGFGSFSIMAGFMLIGVLMALLVEERKRILATARALGAQRSHLTIAAAQEGALYALMAAFAGLLGAAALAAAMMRAASSIFAEENARAVLVVKVGTILSSVGFGFSLTLGVIALTAYWTTRMQIAAALKDEEVDAPRGRIMVLLMQIFAMVVGTGLMLFAIVSQNALSLVVGPTLLLLGIAPIAARGKRRNLAIGLMGGLLTAYLIASFWFIELNSASDFASFPLRAVLLAVTLGIIVSYSTFLHRLISLAARISKRGAPVIEAALANLGKKPFRSALTVAMIAMVLIILTALGTMFATFAPNDLGDAGGFDVVADTRIHMDDPQAYLEENPPASGIDPFAGVDGWVATPWTDNGMWYLQDPSTGNNVWSPFGTRLSDSLVGVTPAFAEAADFRNIKTDGLSSRQAFQQVAQSGNSIIVSDLLQMDNDQNNGQPLRLGQRLQFGSEDDAPTLTVIGIVSGVGSVGAFMPPGLLDDWAADRYHDDGAGIRIWVDAPGRDHADVVHAFESAFRRVSLEATDVDDIDSQDADAGRAFQFIISLFLGLGIIIGMVALGLIMGRNVLLRRMEIGTLRAIGAKPWQILLMFSFEALYLTLFSIAIGFSIGLLIAWRMIAVEELWVPLKVDWGGLFLLYGATLVAALATALIPAFRASRIPPAQAVRYVE